MPAKRKRAAHDDAPTTLKRPRHRLAPDLLSPLSDELLVRILSYLPLRDLLSLAPVSDRFYHLSGDSQIWKRLYYSRFVLPRALRLPGVRNAVGSARDRKLHHSLRRTLWADGRRGGWVDVGPGDGDGRNWKRQYRLRHNWARGKCAVEELQLRPRSASVGSGNSPGMLVKVLEGTAVTADAGTGLLRAWDLKAKQLVAQARLDEDGACASPRCIALDGQFRRQGSLDIVLGFADGSFGTWRLDTTKRQLVRRYRHEASSNGAVIGVALLHPYLLTATGSILISLYTFEPLPPPPDRQDHREEIEAYVEGENDSELEAMQKGAANASTENHQALPHESIAAPGGGKDGRETTLSAPHLLTSLKSHTSRPPLALSLRRTAAGTVASIAYTFATLRGWSLGIQELHIRPGKSMAKSHPEISTTQLAHTLPVNMNSHPVPSPPPSPAGRSRSLETLVEEHSRQDLLSGPTSLSYTHPYLLATLPDNTMILHLCTSGPASLSISPGIRLWGHTSGISDAEITARGKAVSVSCRGEEVRVWELEGRTSGQSVEVRPTTKSTGADVRWDPAIPEHLGAEWDDRRNWVGFDDEMVIVLKESGAGTESFLVYDFT
ncbi:hypothetical protein F4802DRAFT_420104 [Xylaria palmicola]|nr:hypothetical protein F4802DRAFT_420104 [Xylaria palmicola]